MDERSTMLVTRRGERPVRADAPRFTVTVGGECLSITQPTCTIGSHPSSDVIVDDEAASRFHCVIRSEKDGFHLQDEGSLNGTFLDGVRINDGWLRDGSTILVGATELRFALDAARYEIPLHHEDHFGDLVGHSVAMRRVFAILQRAADSNATVLLEGETGTGKEGCAEALHMRSARSEGPFVVVDVGALPPNLLESELFGHEKGAFTGATDRHIGAFEAAEGGTVFLDEIGELPSDLQPKLLRVLERKTIRRLGSTQHQPVDVRIVAATHRNLRQAVNEGWFRADLYYRLAVVPIEVPPLRERPEDLDVLVATVLDRLGATDDERARLSRPGFIAQLRRSSWPGNVRELRNHLERCLVLDEAWVATPSARPTAGNDGVDPSLTYQEARNRALEGFEARYLEALIAAHEGNVSQAARAAEMNRSYLYRLLQRHGLR